MPALTDVSGGGIRGVQVAEATPLVFATVPQGATVTSGSFVTTHAGTGRYLVGGLAAGSVNVTRNGSPVAGSPITVTAGEHAIEFTSLAGTIAISAAGGALTILTTSPLPAGTVGSAYSRTLAASGGTPAYTWTVSAGALPPGLTLSGAGLLSGTPSSTGVFSFTARVQDAAAAAVTLPLSLTINTVLGPATTRDIVFRFRPPSGRVVTALRLESGATSGLLATPQTVACTAGCSLTITADTGSSLYFRLRWYNGASPAGAASRIRLITVP